MDIIYAADIENNNKSEDPRINNGLSDIIKVYRGNCIHLDTIQQETHTFSEDKYIYPPIEVRLYLIHNDDETIFIMENNKEYGLVDFLVYNKYMKINLPDIEITVAEYAVNSSFFICNSLFI